MMNTKVLGAAVAVCIMVLGIVEPGQARERRATVTYEVNLNAPPDAKIVRMWVPYPLSDSDQEITNVKISGNYASTSILREGKGENTALFVEWSGPQKERKLVYSFHVKRHDRSLGTLPDEDLPLARVELRNFLEPAPPAGSHARERAEKVVRGKKSILEKARAIYIWTVENLPWDPAAKGAGTGDVEKTLEKKAGRYLDVHAVFVAFCRAAGVPARERMGARLPKAAAGDMTAAPLSWAEFYLPGTGWVPVNPGLVAKLAFDQRPTSDQLKAFREFYFGNADESLIAYGSGRNIVLNPAQSGAPLNAFLYPYAEADGKMLNDDLAGMNLRYRIGFKEE